MRVRRHSRNVDICTKALKKLVFIYDTASSKPVGINDFRKELGSMKFSSGPFLTLAIDSYIH